MKETTVKVTCDHCGADVSEALRTEWNRRVVGGFSGGSDLDLCVDCDGRVVGALMAIAHEARAGTIAP